jgi:hypothetical protein
MPTNKDVELGISAKDDGLSAGFAQAKAATEKFAEDVKRPLDAVGEAFRGIGKAFAAATAILAGGEAFRKAIEASVELTKESVALGKQLGVTATDASILKVAMGEAGVSQETLSGAASRMTRTLNTNEEAFTSLGVATRDANGNFRATFDIMQDVNARLLQFKEGTDRNIEGTKIYGRGWSEIAPVLKLNAINMEEATEKAESLGLVVGQENVDAARKYRVALNDVHEVFEGVLKTIGDAMLPLLTDLGQWFASIGPDAVDLMKKAMLGVVLAFEAARVAVGTLYDILSEFVQKGVVRLMTFADAANHAIRLDFEGAKTAWANGMDQLDQISKATSDSISKRFQSAQDVVSNAMTRAFDKPIAAAKSGGGETSAGGSGKAERRLAEWEAELEADKVAYQEKQRLAGSFVEFSKQQEVAFWTSKLALVEKGSADETSIRTRISKALLEIDKARFAGELEQLKAQEAALARNAGARIAIEQEYAERVRKAYGEDSKAYAEARRSVIETEKKAQDELRQIADAFNTVQRNAALTEVDNDLKFAQEKLANHRITQDQMIEIERQLEDRRFQLQEAALEEKRSLVDPSTDPVSYAKLTADIEQLAITHNNRMQEIARQSASLQDQIWKSVGDSIDGAFSRSFSSFLRGTESIGQAVRGLFIGIAQSVVQSLEQIAVKQVTTLAEQMIFGKTTALATITGHAAEAGSAAFAATAAIPVIGPELAPEAAAAAYSGALSFAALSAAGGFDVPANLAPVTQLHPKEMVLPDRYAEVIRAMADQGAASSGGTGDVHVHVNALDQRSVQAWATNPRTKAMLRDVVFGNYSRIGPALR